MGLEDLLTDGTLLGVPCNWRELIGHLCYLPCLAPSGKSSPLNRALTCCLTLLRALLFTTTSSPSVGSGAREGPVMMPLQALPGSVGRPSASSSDDKPMLSPSSVSEGCSALYGDVNSLDISNTDFIKSASAITEMRKVTS